MNEFGTNEIPNEVMKQIIADKLRKLIE